MQHIFLNNYQLCSEVSEPVLQHFVHLLATHGRHVQYLDFLHTVIKAEGKYVKKCQDMIMTEVRAGPRGPWDLGGGHRGGTRAPRPRAREARQCVTKGSLGCWVWRGRRGRTKVKRQVSWSSGCSLTERQWGPAVRHPLELN